mgnify:CR=1 FL=1
MRVALSDPLPSQTELSTQNPLDVRVAVGAGPHAITVAPWIVDWGSGETRGNLRCDITVPRVAEKRRSATNGLLRTSQIAMKVSPAFTACVGVLPDFPPIDPLFRVDHQPMVLGDRADVKKGG